MTHVGDSSKDPMLGAAGTHQTAPAPSAFQQLQAKTREKSYGGMLDSCSNCVRLILIVGNCIFFFLGCTVIGLGVYLVVDKVLLITGLFDLRLVAPASYIIIITGCIIFIISFIGCFGALFESRNLLYTHATVLAVVLTLSCAGLTLAFLFRAKVKEEIQEYMHETLTEEYGVNLKNAWNYFVTDSWDRAQVKWQCCAVEDGGWEAYKNSSWYKLQHNSSTNIEAASPQPAIPRSCCKINERNEYVDLAACQFPDRYVKNSTSILRSINYKGCFEMGIAELDQISGYIICIGIATASVGITGMALSFFLARKINQSLRSK